MRTVNCSMVITITIFIQVDKVYAINGEGGNSKM